MVLSRRKQRTLQHLVERKHLYLRETVACQAGGWGWNGGCQTPPRGHDDRRLPRQKKSRTSQLLPKKNYLKLFDWCQFSDLVFIRALIHLYYITTTMRWSLATDNHYPSLIMSPQWWPCPPRGTRSSPSSKITTTHLWLCPHNDDPVPPGEHAAVPAQR